MSKLTVYKASAGSGKTYTLTLRYLELLFRDEFAYRNILAVTFTNKAASEMKSRIMETLHKLSAYKPSSLKPVYLEHLSKKYSISEEEVCLRATRILNYILNDYSRFSVGTIDKFFQMVIRAFTREIGLQAGYNLELNNDKVLSEAVDNLLYSMDENLYLREWLIKFAEEEIKEGHNVNLKSDLVLLGKEIFKENYRNLSRNIDEIYKTPERIREYQEILSKEINDFRNNLVRISKSAINLIRECGLEADDFSNKESGALGFFYSIQSVTKKEIGKYRPLKTPLKAIDNPEIWYTKTSPKKDQIINAYNKGLNKLLKEAIEYSDSNFTRFRTAMEIRKFIYAYGILADLSGKVREITTEKNMFLLSDSAEFLNEIIADNEAPFVYEKAGNFFRNFMLDEFQDTSVFQWNNFRPLVLNGLASGNASLVVGDVKQSIYRWRNSDWKILASEVEKNFLQFYVPAALQENYRSSENIIRFNNSLFSSAPQLLRNRFLSSISESIHKETLSPLADMITWAYEESTQLIPPKAYGSGGYVRFSVLEKGLNKEDYLEEIKRKIPETIIDLQKRGYHAGDIALLVRKGEEGKQIANILLEYKNRNKADLHGFNFNVISNDSLYIATNPAVQLLLAVMKWMRNPFDMLNEAFIRHEFLLYLNEGYDIPQDYHHIFTGKTQDHYTAFLRVFESLSTQHENLRHLSLFELIEQLCKIFGLHLNRQDTPYIQAFQDIVLSFMKKEASDHNSFLDYWEDQGIKETLNISEQQDAIRIFTIHKAKGLEFRVVIVPFCNWGLEPSPTLTNILWCKTNKPPFDFLPFVPVNYGSGLSNTYFSGDYFMEKLHSFVDNLNLSYVAFTRAIDELHVFASPGDKNKNIGDLLLNALDENLIEPEGFPYMLPEIINRTTNLLFEYGAPKSLPGNSTQKDKLAEVFDEYPVAGFPKEVKIRYRSDEFFTLGTPVTGDIDYGIIMHNILSNIRYPADLKKAVNASFLEGKIDRLKQKEILEILSRKLEFPPVKSLFNPDWQVFTEREILTGVGQEYRPDRVMVRENSAVVVDYKFGTHLNPGYASQLRKYMKLLLEIGYKDVKSFIWYVILDKWEEVKYDA
jgi:ATP-dependent exoDNAse (exonuclease V) beta subunit